MKRALLPTLTFVLCTVPAAIKAQTPLPNTQPALLTVYREEVKYGHNTDHEMLEAGWPAAYLKAKSPNTYIAITSMTGPQEAWFIQPFTNYKAMDDAQKLENSNPVLAAEVARLQKADAEHVNAGRLLHLQGRPDLSGGTFPSVGKIRYYEITTMRVRIGHEREFEQVAKAFQAAYRKGAPEASYRIYQVVAGMPGPTFMIFSSVPTLGDFDKAQAMDAAAMGALSAEDQALLQKFALEGLVAAETQRFAMNGRMSYVDDATAASDPGFWRPGVKASK